jgi:hypothetical protein
LPNGDGVPQEQVAEEYGKIAEPETTRQLSVNIKLNDGVDLAEALAAVEGLGEVQNLSIYLNRYYSDSPF